MRASAESLQGHQVNRKLSLSPTTCCRDEEQCFGSAALSRRGVPLAPRSLVHTSRRCSSTVSLCRLVLIGASVKYRPLTCSERLEYTCIVSPTPFDFKTAEHSHHQTCALIPSSAAPVRPSDCREVVSTHQNLALLRFWAVPYTSSCMTHAVSTIPTSSSKLIVTLRVSPRAALRFSSGESARGKSYLQ